MKKKKELFGNMKNDNNIDQSANKTNNNLSNLSNLNQSLMSENDKSNIKNKHKTSVKDIKKLSKGDDQYVKNREFSSFQYTTNQMFKSITNDLGVIINAINIQNGSNQESINDIQKQHPFIKFDFNSNSIYCH